MSTGRVGPQERRWLRRAATFRSRGLVITVVLAVVGFGAIPPANAAAAGPLSVSWSGIWGWLTHRTPALTLPAQQAGTARGLPHRVSASATRAGRGRTGPG